jgi:N-acetylmuramoyl-L-alanine amidase
MKRHRIMCLRLLGILAILLAPYVARAEIAARSAAFVAEAGVTTLTVEFDAAPAFEVFALADPARIVIDLPRVAWRLSAPRPAGLATRLRFGLGAQDASRLVIDLSGPARVVGARMAPVSGGGTLVVALAPTDAAQFAARAGWPEGKGPSGAASGPSLRRAPMIAIDPGHGGIDPGAAHGAMLEKDVTLAFSRALARALRAAGFEAMLTREDDAFVPLGERVARARAARADALLSIHADTLSREDVSGLSVYTYSDAAFGADADADAEAAALAERENSVDILGGAALAGEGGDVARAVIDLVQRETMAATRRLGPALIGALEARVAVLPGHPLRAAAFVVLRAPDIPSALIELGFLSSEADRARFADPVWRAHAVDAIVAALSDWADADGLAALSP